MFLIYCLILLQLYLFCGTETQNLDNFQGFSVIRLTPKNQDQLQFLVNLTQNHQFDFWTFPRYIGQPVDIMTSPFNRLVLEIKLKNNNISNTVLINDIERFEKSQNIATRGLKLVSSEFFTQYQSVDSIYHFISQIEKSDPMIASVVTIGKTFENRSIKMIRLGFNHKSKTKPVIWIDAGIHAREWIAPATACYIINQLAIKRNTSEISNLLKKFDWYIVPVVNPDGYEFSRTNNRMWRKNRSKIEGSRCRGVDLNRNFDIKWNVNGGSNNPCSDIYSGPKANSEPEARVIKNQILANRNRIKAYITFHSYGQYFLYPWGWTKDLSPDSNDLHKKAVEATNALAQLYNTKYTVGSPARLMYEAAGGSDDWSYGKAGIKYVYTMELPDKGQYGFLLPPNKIIQVGEETWIGIKTLAKAIRSNGRHTKRN